MTELFVNFIYFGYNIDEIIRQKNLDGTYEDGIVKDIGTGLRTVFQSIGFLILKKARDPLEGIQ